MFQFEGCDIKGCKDCCCSIKPNLFNTLDKDSKEILFNKRNEVEFKAGETIFKQNMIITHICCLKEGLVKMSSETTTDKSLLLRIVQQGEIFGGMGLYIDEVHQATCTAITNIKCCFIDINSFKETLIQNNRFAISLIKDLNGLAIKSKEQAINLTTKSMYARVADMLVYLSEKIYKTENFTTSLKRQDLADLCSITKESLIRILKEFKDNGYISVSNNNISIHKIKEIKHISKFN